MAKRLTRPGKWSVVTDRALRVLFSGVLILSDNTLGRVVTSQFDLNPMITAGVRAGAAPSSSGSRADTGIHQRYIVNQRGLCRWRRLVSLLHALEAQALLKSRRKLTNGRTRVYYAATGKGRRRLAQMTAQWQRVSTGINAALQDQSYA